MLLSSAAYSQETGESCAKIEDGVKRLECYDSIFAKTEPSASKEDEIQKPNWDYKQFKDDMRDAITYMAVNTSLNTVDLGAPYNEDNLLLSIRKSPDGNDVIFIGHGLFNSCYSDCKFTAKFDDDKLETYEKIRESGRTLGG